jgi:hypothetical protein
MNQTRPQRPYAITSPRGIEWLGLQDSPSGAWMSAGWPLYADVLRLQRQGWRCRPARVTLPPPV